MSEPEELSDPEFSDFKLETEEFSTDDRDVSDGDAGLNDKSSDEADFAILGKDSVDVSEDGRGDNSDDEREFSIIEHEAMMETSADEMERDFSDNDPDQGGDNLYSEQPHVRRLMDSYVNVGPSRQQRAFYRQKVRRIERVLGQDTVDVAELRQQAISAGGLINAELRRKAWPLLLNVNVNNIAPKPGEDVLKAHRDYNQVVLDVDRSIRRFPPGMEETHRLFLQDKLVDVIMRVLVKHPELYYYQGFHDICVTFLLVVDEDLAFALVEKLAVNHLRDFMEKTMERTQQLLDYIPSLIRRANPELHQHMETAELGSLFCISWLLTWFGHVLSDIKSILRIYDFFVACHPLMPVYVMGAVLLYREKEILATEAEMSALHQLLTCMPENLPFEHLLSAAGDLYLQYPPTELANEAIRRFKRAQEAAAARRAGRLQRRKQRGGYLPDGNVTFSRVTVWMMGAVVSVAAYALLSSMDWGLESWIPH